MYASLIKIYFWSLREESKDHGSKTWFGEHNMEAWWPLCGHFLAFTQLASVNNLGATNGYIFAISWKNNRFLPHYLIIPYPLINSLGFVIIVGNGKRWDKEKVKIYL